MIISINIIHYVVFLDQVDIDLFKTSIVDMIEHHSLRQLCFEDTQFTNPMDLFISILRILIK